MKVTFCLFTSTYIQLRKKLAKLVGCPSFKWQCIFWQYYTDSSFEQFATNMFHHIRWHKWHTITWRLVRLEKYFFSEFTIFRFFGTLQVGIYNFEDSPTLFYFQESVVSKISSLNISCISNPKNIPCLTYTCNFQ